VKASVSEMWVIRTYVSGLAPLIIHPDFGEMIEIQQL
jgi:hypothetical protein